MTPDLFHAVAARFDAYAAEFAGPDGVLPPLSLLKLDHSRRVCELAGELADRSGWTLANGVTARAAGLLHDIGRFSQLAEYGTFRDAASVDHAERGFDVLCARHLLADLDESRRDQVLQAVRYHNRRLIPDHVLAAALPYLRLVRDADKIDIFYVLDRAAREGHLEDNPDIALKVDMKAPPSDDVMAHVRARQSVPYDRLRSLPDIFLAQLVWVYDFNYPASLALMVERDIIARLADHLPPTDEMRALVEEAAGFAASAQDLAPCGV